VYDTDFLVVLEEIVCMKVNYNTLYDRKAVYDSDQGKYRLELSCYKFDESEVLRISIIWETRIFQGG